MNCQMDVIEGTTSFDIGATGGISSSNGKHIGQGQSDVDGGWWYVNEQGGMCGPYKSQELFSGLETGFLPEELQVYPVSNGTLMVPVPLKLFKQYPEHIATGFTYLGRDTFTSPAMANRLTNSSQKDGPGLIFSDRKLTSVAMVGLQQPLSWEYKCWLYLDSCGKPTGPYSLGELYDWHQYGYLHNSVMVYHFENKSSQFTLLSLMDAWRNQNSYSGSASGNSTTGTLGFLSRISDDVGSRLHDGIMKTARRLVLDEIIGNVIEDFMTTKKAEKQLKTDLGFKGSSSHFLHVEKIDALAGESNGPTLQSAIVSCHNVSSLDRSANKFIKEPSFPQYTESVGGLEHFEGTKTAVSRVLFDHCMQVMWNAVFYDPIINHLHSWRRNRCWSSKNIEETATLAEETGFQKHAEIRSEARERSLPAEELDFPPGFQPMEKDSPLTNLSLTPCSPYKEDILSSPRSSISTQQFDVIKQGVFARVDKELFLASKLFLADFVKTSVEGEANKLSNSLKDSQSKKVPAEMSGQICNTIGRGDCATLGKAQESDCGQISLDNSQACSHGLSSSSSSSQPASFRSKSSFRFLESGFSRLGKPSSSITNNLKTDEPPPPGPSDSVNEPFFPPLLEKFRSRISKACSSRDQGLASRHEHCSSDFFGSAFKRLGKPRCGEFDDRRTDEPPPPGSESDKAVAVRDRKLGRLVLDVSIPKWRRFVFLAICRQKLHDDVLREWKSSLDDLLYLQLNLRTPSQEEAVKETVQPELDLDMGRSKSYNSSGPSQVSFFDKFTYSRRTKAPKTLEAKKGLSTPGDDKVRLKSLKKSGEEKTMETKKGSSPLGDNKVFLQSSKKHGKERIFKNGSSTGALGLENKNDLVKGSCLKGRGSVSGISKVGTSGKRNLSMCQSGRSSSGQKVEKIALVSQNTASVKDAKRGVDSVSVAEDVSKDINNSLSISEKGNFISDRSQQMEKSSEMSSLKKKRQMDKAPSVQSKAPKLVKTVAKQAAGVDSVSGAEDVSNEICTSFPIAEKEKTFSDHSEQMEKSSEMSRFKRKHQMDKPPSVQSKVPKFVKADVKQAAGRSVGKRKIQASKARVLSSCPVSDGCARCSIDGWEWRKWSVNARPADRARVRGTQKTTMQRFGRDLNVPKPSYAKGVSARTNRIKMRNLLAAAEGIELLKASQLKTRKKRLHFQRSKIHDWGLIALETIEAEDFVIEYVGELIRPSISDIRELEYEKTGIGSSYLFRLDDGHVVDATKRGGIARFINHSCEPNCYTKIVSVEGQKRIFIYAKRRIAAGEELTYNYKFPLEEKKIPCNCGSKRCRGSMN